MLILASGLIGVTIIQRTYTWSIALWFSSSTTSKHVGIQKNNFTLYSKPSNQDVWDGGHWARKLSASFFAGLNEADLLMCASQSLHVLVVTPQRASQSLHILCVTPQRAWIDCFSVFPARHRQLSHSNYTCEVRPLDTYRPLILTSAPPPGFTIVKALDLMDWGGAV